MLCKNETLNANKPKTLTLKRLGGQFDPPCSFSKNVCTRERVKPCIFVNFNIIISHILFKIPLKFLKSFRIYEDFLRQYQLISSIFRIFWDFLVTKKLMTSEFFRAGSTWPLPRKKTTLKKPSLVRVKQEKSLASCLCE